VSAAALVVVAVVLFVRRLDFAALRRALAQAAPGPIALACVLAFVNLWFKALYWRFMLARYAQLRTFRIFRYTLAGVAASALAPARAGDALRVWLLSRHHGVPLRVSAGVTLVEKVFDVLSLVVVIVPLAFASALPAWVTRTVAALTGVAVIAIAAGVLLLRYGGRVEWLRKALDGLEALRRPRLLLGAAAAVLAAWLVDAAVTQAVMVALGAAHGSDWWYRPALVLLTVNLAIAVPATPGHLGALEVGAVLGLELCHVPRPTAVAFALLYHAVQIVPLMLAGLMNGRLVLSARRIPATTQPLP
jgi:uncharacterized membrane protein YbhN (UPF0104 family)